jgi:polysaccharide deacetylase 2 family uncharacterized protein YibQ
MAGRRPKPEETAETASSPVRPLAIAAGGLVLVLIAGGIWLQLSGPPPSQAVAVSLPAPPTVAALPSAPAAGPPAGPPAEAPASTPAPAPAQEAAKAETPAEPVKAPAAAPAPPPPPAETAQSLLPPPVAQDAPAAPPPGYNRGQALAPAPDGDLIERVATGYLPVIGRDGRQPWQVYARPFDLADKRPRVALVITSLGMSATQTDAAINHLPVGVTLAFQPYARKLGEWINLARAAGHEVLLTLPMEPIDYPRNDPGPNGLLTALEPAKNLERFNWILSQGTGYIGLVGFEGSRFSTGSDDMKPILDVLKRRGLLYVDNRETAQTAAPAIAADIKLPFASSNRAIDRDATRAGVDKRLAELEDIARRNGAAVGIGSPFPVTFERVAVWAQGLEDRGVVLAPVSAVIGKTHEQVPQKGEPPNKDVDGAGAAANKDAPASKDAPAAKGAPAGKDAPAAKDTAAAGTKPTAAAAKQE